MPCDGRVLEPDPDCWYRARVIGRARMPGRRGEDCGMAGIRDADRSAESRRILERIAREADAGGIAGRTMGRARDHFAAADVQPDDRLEVWGTRIGRAIAAVVLGAMLVWALSRLAGA
jgi:hypothetical protein